MTETGRATVREMRMVSQSGLLTLLLYGADRLFDGLEQGFVWIENGRVIGNVSVSPSNMPRSDGLGFIIANVAVHPDYQRQGLAHSLMFAALDLVQAKRGDFAILQVDADNEVAIRLYKRVGFRIQRSFIQWYRSPQARTPARLREMPPITLRQPNEWQSEFALARLVRPDHRGGLSWLRATHPNNFRPSFWQGLTGWTLGRSEERWIIRHPDTSDIIGSLHKMSSFGGPDRLELLVHPSQRGRLEEPLLNYGLRSLEGRRSIIMEHPEDDDETTGVLQQYAFQRRQTLISMRYDF
jgi:ribosomal protein S18 acetylase RimI-like enzyme